MADIRPVTGDETLSSSNQNKVPPRHFDYGGNPLARYDTANSFYASPFGGAFQPGVYKERPSRKIGNGAPLGLSGFAATTVLLSLINLGVRGLDVPNIVVGVALAYGGFIQILAGMWEMATGNTFGATALTSYGGFWVSLAIVFTPAFGIADAYGGMGDKFYQALGLFIMAWFIFTVLMWICTLRSTFAFSSLFFFVWLDYLCIGLAYLYNDGGMPAKPQHELNLAGGVFGILAGFIAWWNMISGLLTPGNSFFLIPVLHFPWSETGRERKYKKKQQEEESLRSDPEKQA